MGTAGGWQPAPEEINMEAKQFDSQDHIWMSFEDYIVDYIRDSTEFIRGVKRGLDDWEAGRVRSWDAVQASLNLGGK